MAAYLFCKFSVVQNRYTRGCVGNLRVAGWQQNLACKAAVWILTVLPAKRVGDQPRSSAQEEPLWHCLLHRGYYSISFRRQTNSERSQKLPFSFGEALKKPCSHSIAFTATWDASFIGFTHNGFFSPIQTPPSFSFPLSGGELQKKKKKTNSPRFTI